MREQEEKPRLVINYKPLNKALKWIRIWLKDLLIIYDRLKKNPKAWSNNVLKAIKRIKEKDIGYGGVLTFDIVQILSGIYIVEFYYGKWNPARKNYATIAKEILAI
ncbi:hypothetical protein H5410_064981, partial [Solanum commersonii]